MKLTPLRHLSLALLSVILAQCTSPPATEDPHFPAPQTRAQPLVNLPKMEAPSTSMGIQPGDQIELFLDEDPSFNGLYAVRPEGHILVPKVGRVHVAGKSRVEAEQAIRSRFEATQVRSATLYVEVVSDRISSALSPRVQPSLFPGALPTETVSSDAFHLTGRVNRPGQYDIPLKYAGRLGIYEAILMHGGVANFGDKTKVELLRHNEQGELTQRRINLNKIPSGEETNHLIGDGDIINVPEKVFGF